jgi:hypothetical protein
MSAPGLATAAAESPGVAHAPAAACPVWSRRDTLLVSLLCALAVVRGLLFASVQWPWYAPDEQDHVEYALLIRHHGPLVSRDQIDEPLRLAIATSLYDWHALQRAPAEGDPLARFWTGEVGRQPALYYLLAGWAAALVPGDALLAQIYAMRGVSALIGGLIVALMYLAGRLLQPAAPAAAIGLAGVALFQTPLGALSGAVTNDGLAVLALTLVLVASIALLRRPRPARQLVTGAGLLVAALLIALLAKRTAVPALPAGGLALGVVAGDLARRWLVPRGWHWPALALVAAALVALPFALLTRHDDRASHWSLVNAARVPLPDAGGGGHGLLLGAGDGPAEVAQRLTDARAEALRGQRLTVGVWLRLAQPGPPRPVTLRVRQTTKGKRAVEQVEAGATPDWQFAAVPIALAPDASSVVVSVVAGPGAGGVLLDRVALARGEADRPATPVVAGRTLRWEGGTGVDALENPAFEAAPLGIRPWVRQVLQDLIHRDPEALLEPGALAGRLPKDGQAWRLTIWEPFFISLWGRLGRVAELAMPPWWYAAHGVVLAAGAAGALIGALRGVRRAGARQLWLGAVLAVAALGSAVIALGPYVLDLYPGYPAGRYFLPALLPLACLYVWGLVGIWPRRLQGVALLVLLGILAGLDTYALFYELPAHFTIGGPRLP